MPSLKSQSGQSVLEVILVIAIFSILSVGVVISFYSSAFASKQALQYGMARGYVKEAMEAVRSIRDQDWNLMTNGTFGLSTAAAKYAFAGASDSLQSGTYTRSITIADAFRTESLNGDLASSGTLDKNTKKVSVNLSWQLLSGQLKNLVSVFYVMNWEVLSWVQTLVADFSVGTRVNTDISNVGDGEIVLKQSNEWTNANRMSVTDKPGGIDPTKIVTSGNYTYVVTANDASGPEFYIFDTSNLSAPLLVGSTEIGATVNDVAISGNYAYLATSNGSKELIVVDMTNKSAPVFFAFQNISGTANMLSVAISGSTLYMGRAQSAQEEFYVYDVSVPSNPASRGTLPFSSNINAIVVSGNYVYAAINANPSEFEVFNVTNPDAPAALASYDAPGSANAFSLAVSGNLVAIGRAASSKQELYFLNVSNPASPTLSGSAEVGSTVNGIALDGTSYAYLATSSGSVPFERWDLSDLASPSLSSTVDLGGVGKSIVFQYPNAIVASALNSGELQVVGPSTSPPIYASTGDFVSQAFDSGSETATLGTISWAQTGTGSVSFWIRTADTQTNLSSATWVGVNGETTTPYSISGALLTKDSFATGTQWIQFRATESGDTVTTPSISNISITYTP